MELRENQSGSNGSWLLIIFFTVLVVCILSNAVFIGYTFKQNIREKRTNDSLTIVKLKLEIQLKKLELNAKN